MRVVIVGRGRLGRTLAGLWPAAGHDVALVSHESPVPHADAVVLCVPDDAVADAAARVPVGPVVLHCAGALDLDVLAPHEKRASVHPLMTFPGPEIGVPPLTGVPAAVAGTPDGLPVATRLAEDLGLEPFVVPGDCRLYHAAAVLCGNFPMVLLVEGAALLRAAGVDEAHAARVLVPLALRAVENAPHGLAALTGPVARADVQTLAAHLAALQEHGLDEVALLYASLLKHALARLGIAAGPPSRSS